MSKHDYSRTVSVEFDFASEKTFSPSIFGDNLEHTRDCTCAAGKPTNLLWLPRLSVL